jgi:hypothetical protein
MSLRALNALADQWSSYTHLFKVECGITEANEIVTGGGDFHTFYTTYDNEPITFYFLNGGQKAATFSWSDKRSIDQIEKMTSYKVKPRGIVSQFKHGGFVVFEENGHGFVAALFSLGKHPNRANLSYPLKWTEARLGCDELVLNGYSDWQLPTKDELKKIYDNYKLFGLGGFKNFPHWSRSQYKENEIRYQDFRWWHYFSEFGLEGKKSYEEGYARAVRLF